MNEYTTVSFPKPLIDDITKLVKEVGYWPSGLDPSRTTTFPAQHHRIRPGGTCREAVRGACA